MDMGKLIGLVIASIMMLVIVVTVVVPVLQDASYNSLGTNEADSYYGAVPDGTITWSTNGYSVDGGEKVVVGSGTLIISDSMVVMTTASSMRLYDYAGGNYGTISSIVINGSGYTTTGTTVATGSLGENALIALGSSDGATHGMFTTKSFYIDKNKELRSFRAGISMVDGENGTADARVLCFGTVTDLDAYAVNLTSDVYTPWTSFAASIVDTSYTEPNSAVYYVSGETELNYSGTYDGDSYTGSPGSGARFIAPLDYTQVTDTGGAIKSMLDIVPLLMVIGVIIMIAVAVVSRS